MTSSKEMCSFVPMNSNQDWKLSTSSRLILQLSVWTLRTLIKLINKYKHNIQITYHNYKRKIFTEADVHKFNHSQVDHIHCDHAVIFSFK